MHIIWCQLCFKVLLYTYTASTYQKQAVVVGSSIKRKKMVISYELHDSFVKVSLFQDKITQDADTRCTCSVSMLIFDPVSLLI